MLKGVYHIVHPLHTYKNIMLLYSNLFMEPPLVHLTPFGTYYFIIVKDPTKTILETDLIDFFLPLAVDVNLMLITREKWDTNPHYHIILPSLYKIDAIRNRLARRFDLKGRDKQVKKIDDKKYPLTKAISHAYFYILKEGHYVYTGDELYTVATMDLIRTYWAENYNPNIKRVTGSTKPSYSQLVVQRYQPPVDDHFDDAGQFYLPNTQFITRYVLRSFKTDLRIICPQIYKKCVHSILNVYYHEYYVQRVEYNVDIW